MFHRERNQIHSCVILRQSLKIWPYKREGPISSN